MAPGLRPLLACALLTLCGAAAAERWTVQTIAHRDFRNAQSVQQELIALGFDAYVDFATSGGVQFARVRVGCFDSREAAVRFAEGLAGSVTREAVAVPLEIASGFNPNYCLRREVGFIVPESWRQLEAGHRVVFEVTTLGNRALIVHDGRSWRLYQPHEDISALSPPARYETPFDTVSLLGFQRVRYRGTVIAHGELLWQKDNVAVVLEDDTVIAYAVEDY